jgi:hypothetical protein
VPEDGFACEWSPFGVGSVFLPPRVEGTTYFVWLVFDDVLAVDVPEFAQS